MATREPVAGAGASPGGLAGLLAGAARTTAFRIAASAVGLFMLGAALIFGVLFLKTNDALTQATLSSVRSEARDIAASPMFAELNTLAQAIAQRGAKAGVSLYYLADAAGTKLAGNLDRLPAELAQSPTGGVFHYRASADAPERLAVALPLDAGGGVRLWVGRDIEDQRSFAADMRRSFMVGFGLLSLLGLLGAFAIGRLLLGRIEAINETSRSIMAGDLTRRVALAGTGDELDGLATNLNAMLARIERLMASVREVSDNIAHDLKTPLNRLRNRAEAALRDDRGAPAYREGLERTIDQADEIIRIFNSLLLIARVEAGAIDETMAPVDLGRLVADCAELYDPVAEERGLTLTVEAGSGPMIRANKHLLGQAVANLVDNAIKYSAAAAASGPASGAAAVTVRVSAGRDGPEVAIGDRGPGISAEDRERVLRRFVRLEESRTEPGTGLGLSLVAAVARLHGGVVRLEDNAPGLRVVLALPQGLVTG